MIIRFPTGFYKNSIAAKAGESGNVTYVISNSEPKRTDLLYPKIPSGIVYRKRPARTVDKFDRRQHLGELVYSVSRSSQSVIGNASRQYEIGQILEFETSAAKQITPMLVSEKTEIRHDTNLLDYTALGLSADDTDKINQSSITANESLTNQLNDLRQLRANAEEEISTNQKLINDTDRAINALTVIKASTGDASLGLLIAKLVVTKSTATAARDAAMASADALAASAATITEKIRTIATVLR